MKVTRANLTIAAMSREDVHAEFTCQASNFDATVLRTGISIDMKCKGLFAISDK